MAFYDLSKYERTEVVHAIDQKIIEAIQRGETDSLEPLFNDDDTYVRKATYQSIGKAFHSEQILLPNILKLIQAMLLSKLHHCRQTAINAAGEIGMTDFNIVQRFFESALTDPHHSVRNAVIGSIKKMGQKNPSAIFSWIRPFFFSKDVEIRRIVCHGIELRGRTHPQEVLPFLKLLQFDRSARVRNTLIHVLGQIAYKKECLEKVIAEIKTWENQDLIKEAYDEIIDVHGRYKDFAAYSQSFVRQYIALNGR